MKIYRNNLKNREFGKEGPQNFRSEGATIAEGQGATENGNSGVNLTPPKPDSSGCFGITKNHTSIRVQYILKDLNDNPLVGSYQMEEPPVLYLNEIIPGLFYGLLGMKEGEIREIFIHPDFVYGTASDFGNGQAIKATVELVELGERQDHVNAPFLQPIDVADFSPEISSCAEFVEFQKKHAYACGFRSWSYYKNTGCSLELVLNNMAEYSGADLSESDEELLLKLEWLLNLSK